MRAALVVLLAFGAQLGSTSASAQRMDASDASASGTGLRYDLTIDLGITLGATAFWASFELLAPVLATSCHWCDRNSDGSDSLNGFDRGVRKALRWHDTKSADILSTVFSFGLAPLAGVGVGALIAAHDQRLGEIPEDILIVGESAMLALDLTQITKFSVSRERPNVHARTPAERAARRASSDNLSFFSGHTSLAFALATSAGTIASMRHYRLAPWMWIAGLTLAATSGYLRIAADRHYATDVITGMVAGSAVGVAVPYLGHQPRAAGVHMALAPLPEGQGVALLGVF
jgi:membrane-associated phospholipid phosphatase